MFCANCHKKLNPSKHLIKFDRSDEDMDGILLSPETAINERLVNLTKSMDDLLDRMERIEIILLEEHSEEIH